MSDEAIRDRLECDRIAAAFMQRMVAAWRDAGDLAKSRHASAGGDTVVSFGPSMPIVPDGAGAQRHGACEGGTDTIIVFGPSIEIPRNPS
jgi:hypothetical protein